MSDFQQGGHGNPDPAEGSGRNASAIEVELRNLRRHVDELQIAQYEKHKPWYRQVTVLLSLLALAFSVGTTLYIQIGSRHEEIRSKKEELRKIVSALIELSDEYARRTSSLRDPQAFGTVSALLTRKRMTYIEAADFLASQIPAHISSSEYFVLAWEHAFISDFAGAEKYFLKGIKVASTQVTKVVALRALAIFYFQRGPLHNVDKARQYFDQSLDVVKGASDPYSLQLSGETYLEWGIQERLNGFETEGRQKLDLARSSFSALPSDYPMRENLLRILSARTEQVLPVGTNVVPPAAAKP